MVFTPQSRNLRSIVRIALVGEYSSQVIAHQAIPKALALAATVLNCECETTWVATDQIESDPLSQLSIFQGIWCVPATPYRSMNGALNAIRFARNARRPFLGTCGGFQHVVIEYARHVLGMTEADHAESNPAAHLALITPLACPMVEKEGTVHLLPNSLALSLCGNANLVETYHCRYGINRKWEHFLFGHGLRIAGTDQDGEVRVIEIPDHPFFMATLFQPERSALRSESHPLIQGFVRAACGEAGGSSSCETG